MELRHIRYFVALAEELSFSRAAEKLHISQPPLSRQIAELEQELGTPLFVRTTRQVTLTNAGKVFLNKAYQILDQVDQAVMSTRLSSAGQAGELRIGFTGAVQDLIPKLKKFQERYPQVGITLQHMNSTAQIEALHDKTIDIGFISIPVNHNKIKLQPLKPMRFVAVLPENHPLAAIDAVSIQDMADENFIVTTKAAGASYYEAFISLFHQYSPRITMQAADLQTVLALVAGGMGVTLSPSPVESVNGIVTREIRELELYVQPSLAWRTDNPSEVLNEFLGFVDEMKAQAG